jgi:hypothetical protein
MDMRLRRTPLAFAALLAAAPSALAQLTTVPMKDPGNEWVKQLNLRGRMEWEWLETYSDRVYFATRHDAEREGDIVTMWLRIEYKHPQNPLDHRSAVSRDSWDCKKRQRSTLGLVFYKFNNLEDDTPERSTNPLRYWEKVAAGTIGETLLNFACSIRPVTPVVPPG